MTTRLTVDRAFEVHGALLGARAGAGTAELLDGLLVRCELPPSTVVATVVRLASQLDHAAHGLEVDVRAPLACPPHDVLRPEVSVRRPLASHLRRPAPGPASVVVAILVGDDRDSARRARRCGAAGIAEVWIVSPDGGAGARLTAPRGGVYCAREMLLPGESVAPLAAPWVRVVAVASERAAQGPAAAVPPP